MNLKKCNLILWPSITGINLTVIFLPLFPTPSITIENHGLKSISWIYSSATITQTENGNHWHSFYQLSAGVTIRRQQNYHIIFNSFGDLALISNLNRIFYQTRGNILHQSFSTLANIEPNPYQQYILLDCHPKSPFPRSMKLRSNILHACQWFIWIFCTYYVK